MAEFDLEKIKIGNDVYKIAAGGGPNIYKCTSSTNFSYLDLPRSVESFNDLKVGDIIYFEGKSDLYNGITKEIAVQTWVRRTLNVINANGTVGFLPGTRPISLMVTGISSTTLSVFLSMSNVQQKIEMGSQRYGSDIVSIAYKIINCIGGGYYREYSGLVPEVMKRVGSIWRPVEINESYAVYDTEGKLAYIINEYDWDAIWALSSFQYNGSANGFVSAVLATNYTQGSDNVYYNYNAGCDVWYPDSGNRQYQISNSAYSFGGNYAIFGMNGYTFG